jgi:hypothetical protein
MVPSNPGCVRALAALLALAPAAAAAEKGAPARALAPQQAWRKATCGGKYQMLLRQLRVPGDAATYGAFHDLGPQRVAAHAGHKDLPPGHWVYVYPCWYIWRDRTTDPRPPKRAWGPEQATGPPDTPGAGDIVTAWASATPDGQDEWLLLEYAEPVVPAAVLVHETYNPGALARVTAFRLDGEEVELWKGKDPTPVGVPRGISEVKFKAGFKTTRVRIHLASTRVRGWNEIDAVGLRDTEGKVQWARAADASSTYAARGPGLPGRGPLPGKLPRPGAAPRP